MKILVVSDTHRVVGNLEKVLKKVGKIDMLLHCGDVEGDEDRIRAMVSCPVHYVAGNCDYNGENPSDRIVNAEGHIIYMTHGHKYSVGRTYEFIRSMAKANKAEAVFHGHLHIPHVDNVDGIIVASPGSISEPRQEDRKPSYIVLKAEKDAPLELEINFLK